MRLIPGKTKVQIELFKGVSLWDVLIGGIAVAMLLLVLLSSLPYKLVGCIIILVIAAMLLVRLDTEPNYVMVLNMIKHLAYGRHYERVYDDEMLLKKHDGTVKDEFLENYKEKNQNRENALKRIDREPEQESVAGDEPLAEQQTTEQPEEQPTEQPEEVLSEKELIRRENKILKSKTATAEEKDAVWLARAQRSAAKKEAKKAKKSGKPLTQTAGAKPAAKAETAGKQTAKTVKAETAGKQTAKAAKPAAKQKTKPAGKQETKAADGISEKELIRQENLILKSKTATEEEKNAVWLARAQRSAAKKEAKKQAKQERTENADYEFMENVMAFTGIKDDLIEYGGKYYGTVIEIDPVEFRFFSTHRRDNSIEMGVGRVLRSVHIGFAANIVKLERPIIYDKYLAKEEEKLEQIRKSYESGMMSEEELQARVDIENDRLAELRHLCTDKQVVAPFYYICLFESDKKQLEIQTKAAIDSLEKGEMTVRRLDTKELAVFLKYTNQLDFDERDIEKYQPEDYAQWAMPQRVNVKYRTVEVNDIVTHNFRVVKYPAWVGDAWLAGVMSLQATKVVVKSSPMDRGKAIRTIDRSLQELRGQYNATGVDSKRIELEGHINTLSNLLATLQGEGEELLECNIYVTAYDVQSTRLQRGLDELNTLLPEISGMKKAVRRTWQENNFRLNDHFFNQMNAFVGSQVSAYDPEAKNGRGIPSNSLAACYPWIYAHISDEGGFKLGSSEGVPVFIDFFRRDSERVNSNMVIIGKSGSGKSYATKSILSNLASEDAKIFILDPENEYSELAQNLHGKVINVANAQYGRLNPFHIITALDDDEEGGGAAGSFATHLQFLEEFYRQILPDIEKDALEYLNNLTERLYTNRGITPETDLSKLRPEDYPVFDDLYDAVLEEFERTDNEYIRSMLRILVNYVAKFSTGGRNANIWNGPSTVTTDENFTVFNFQAMLSNRNTTIANAQMLLVLKYIDNEIIKNRDYNAKYGLKRKVVVVIDEAHVFIDAKFPIALDFMFQLAKRIRKYNGMQIVITQNIKDFVGSEEIARKSTAIINACQYSFIFALAPNDMHDLCTLYEKAGGISETEQEQIIQAPRGQAFTVMSATSRSTFRVEVPKNMVDMFQDREFHSRYYTGTEGAAAWEDFVSGSRAAHDANSKANKKTQIIDLEDVKQQKNWVMVEEITEEEEDALKKRSKKASGIVIEEIDENASETAFGKSGKAFEDKNFGDDDLGNAAFGDVDFGDDDFDMSDEDLDAMIAKRRAERQAGSEHTVVAIESEEPPHTAMRAASGKAQPAMAYAEEDGFSMSDDEPDDENVLTEKRMPQRTAKTTQGGSESAETVQAIRQLEAVLADFVQTMKQPAAAAVSAQMAGQAVTPAVQPAVQMAEAPAEQAQSAQPALDYNSIVEDVRRQVLAELMDELRAGSVIPGTGVSFGTAETSDTSEREQYMSDSGYAEDAGDDYEDDADDFDELDGVPEIPEIDTEPEDYEEFEGTDVDEEDEYGDEEEYEDEDEWAYEDDEYDFSEVYPSAAATSSAVENTEEEDSEEGGGFDVMSMLRAEARELAAQRKAQATQEVQLSDYAELGGVSDISLEDLAEIVSMLRRKSEQAEQEE